MINKKFKFVCFVAIFILFLFILFFLGVNFSIKNKSQNYIYKTVNEVPRVQTALILGARVWNNGEMSDIFRDRVKVGIELYKSGKVKKILVSGDHGRKEYDEVNAAKKYILEKGIPGEDIFLDHAGFDTYDSMYRARDVFESESIIIVTQDFHLPRAVYIANKLGHKAHGVSSDLQVYLGADRMELREYLARVKAWLDILFKSKPKYLGKIISLDGDGRETWD